ncbi:MAG: ABC transporter substrate-binding protein [Candidatus Tectomicrobia bacterium]|uniref:ABC transporter substrate-binding protein n=1 Tax=Tectimicrobiota bacterium TaxID=2528274 RepID=A0A932HZA8_UNCTE|nr:ABC transporter substrate-binding protein [Candidatus Tectomicrobia bacterium]
MRAVNRHFLKMAVVLFLAGVLAVPAGLAEAAKRTVRVLYPAGLDMEKAAMLVGWNLYLDDIKVEPVVLRGQGNVARALLSGKENVGYQVFSFFAQTVAKGGDMVALAVAEQRMVWAVIAKKDIKSIKELKGKKVAAHDTSGLSASIIDFYANKLGMKRSDFEMLYIRGGENRIAALVAGRIDATVVGLNDVYEATDTGKFHVVSVFSEDAPDLVGPMLVSTSKFIKENPAVVQKLVTAGLRGIRLAYDDPKKFAAEAKKVAPYNDDAMFQKGYKDLVKYKLWPVNGGAPLRATLQKSADWLIANSPEDAKKMGLKPGFKFTDKQTNDTFLQNALKELGRK